MGVDRLLFVADSGSIHTARWIDYFVDEGYEVHLATFSRKNITRCENVYFLSSLKPSNRGGNYHYLLGVRALSLIINNVNPSVINAHYSYSYGLVSFLAKKYANSSANLTIVCHGSDVLDPPLSFIVSRVNRFLLNRSDKVFVVSDQISDRVKSFGIDSNKIFVGQYGVDRKDVAQKKDIDIISYRAYVPNSRIKFLLDNISKLELADKKVIFVLPFIDEYSFKIMQKEYPGIEFFKELDYHELQELVSRSKIYVSATKSDGSSLSLLESMGSGCIPVVSNIISNRSWVLDGVNGFLFNSDDEFREKLNALFDLEDSDFKKYSLLNQNIIESKGDYSVQMKKIERFLIGC